jgi:hypothetical protein
MCVHSIKNLFSPKLNNWSMKLLNENCSTARRPIVLYKAVILYHMTLSPSLQPSLVLLEWFSNATPTECVRRHVTIRSCPPDAHVLKRGRVFVQWVNYCTTEPVRRHVLLVALTATTTYIRYDSLQHRNVSLNPR